MYGGRKWLSARYVEYFKNIHQIKSSHSPSVENITTDWTRILDFQAVQLRILWVFQLASSNYTNWLKYVYWYLWKGLMLSNFSDTFCIKLTLNSLPLHKYTMTFIFWKVFCVSYKISVFALTMFIIFYYDYFLRYGN